MNQRKTFEIMWVNVQMQKLKKKEEERLLWKN